MTAPWNAERLRGLVTYDPETGIFVWRVDRCGTALAGQRAGYHRKDGYWVISFSDGGQKLAHRLAWLYMTGEWPVDMIDHIDGDKSNNRFSNLRQASRSQNMMNMAVPPVNTSGVKGVSLDKSSGRYEAYITVDRKRRSLGRFVQLHDAAAARRGAEQELFGSFARPQLTPPPTWKD